MLWVGIVLGSLVLLTADFYAAIWFCDYLEEM